MSEDIAARWRQWLTDVLDLKNIEINRCLKPEGIVVKSVELHHFCDASLQGYGYCSYVRLLDSNG